MRAKARDITELKQKYLKCEEERSKSGITEITVWNVVRKKEMSDINSIDGKEQGEKWMSRKSMEKTRKLCKSQET